MMAHPCKDDWLLSPGKESDQVVTRMPLSLNKETRGITGQGKVEPRSFIRVNLGKEKCLRAYFHPSYLINILSDSFNWDLN